jgi:3',5'-cyclic AMP phosphodiesterase CpdA
MFTLAHLSDIHLSPMPQPRLGELTPKRLLGYLNWHRGRKRQHSRAVLDMLVADLLAQRPDHIVVGGDLANIGLPAEVKTGTAWLAALGKPEDVTVIPGNHDVYGWHRGDAGIEPWRAWMRGDANSNGSPAMVASQAGFPFVRERGGIALIALSSAVPTPPFHASGRLGVEQRTALVRLLRGTGARGQCRIVLIHHPPLPGQASPTRGLQDAKELAAVLAVEGAELVLHGHNHRSMLAYVERAEGGRIPIVGVPSASAVPGGRQQSAQYHLFEIDRTGSSWRVRLRSRMAREGGELAEGPPVNLNS